MSVTLGAYGDNGPAGWTTIVASEPSGEGSAFVGSGTRKIYVSTSGSNSNPGTQAQPKQTLAAGVALLRNGFPDWLLLKKGDVWTDEMLGSPPSGRSANEPILIGAYGSGARPLLRSRPAIGGQFIGSNSGTGRCANLAIIGLEFYGYTRDPNAPSFVSGDSSLGFTGFSFLAATPWTLIEDCKFTYLSGNVVQTGNATLTFPYSDDPSGTFIMRRNVNRYAYNANSDSTHIFMHGVSTPIFHENFFDNGGWLAGIRARGDTAHNTYISVHNGPAEWKGNISTRASYKGIGSRNGGLFFDNLMAQCPAAMTGFQGADGPAFVFYQNETTYDGNVILDGVNAGSGGAPGGITPIVDTGVDEAGLPGPIVIRNNIISTNSGGTNALAIGLSLPGATVTENVIYDWPLGIRDLNDRNISNAVAGSGGQIKLTLLDAGTAGLYAGDQVRVVGVLGTVEANGDWIAGLVSGADVELVGSVFQNPFTGIAAGHLTKLPPNITAPNQLDTTADGLDDISGLPLNFSEPTRSIASYYQSIGGTLSFTDFLDAAGLQSQNNWNGALTAAAVNSYVRVGFNLEDVIPPQEPRPPTTGKPDHPHGGPPGRPPNHANAGRPANVA